VTPESRDAVKDGALAVIMVVVALAVVLALLIGGYMGVKTIGRAQKRADAVNRVKITEIEIRNQEQRIQIAKQKAEIRRQDAIGVRNAQDEISSTLTPLYVQFEMVEALKAIARSGRNSSVVYIPSGDNGIPLVSTVNPDEVSHPDE
jgi:uncharacterized protein HemX